MSRIKILVVLIVSIFFFHPLLAFDESTQEFTQAEKYFESGNYKQSEQCYRLAADKYKGMGNLSAYIQSRIGECMQYQGRTEEAVLAYRKVQAEYPESPQAGQAQEQIARAYYQAGDYAKAGPEFEKLAGLQEASAASTRLLKKQMELSSPPTEAFGYAAYCYDRAGNKIKAAAMAIKCDHTKNENLTGKKLENQ